MPVRVIVTAFVLVAAALVAAPDARADDEQPSVGPEHGSTFSYKGEVLTGAATTLPVDSQPCRRERPGCHRQPFTLHAPDAHFALTVEVASAGDVDFTLYDEANHPVVARQTPSGNEEASVVNPKAGTYVLAVYTFPAGGDKVHLQERFEARLTIAADGDQSDVAGTCDSSTPLPGEPDAGDHVAVDVIVVSDGVDHGQVEEITELASARSYAALGVSLDLVRIIDHELEGDGTTVDEYGTERDTIHYGSMFDQVRRLLKYRVPSAADVVYAVTDKEITGSIYSLISDSGPAGVAWCIGGIASPATAWGIGEAWGEDRASLAPGWRNRNLSAKVMSHEIGHLLGGVHDHANCVEGVPESKSDMDAGDPQPRPCTLMFNSAGPSSFGYSTLNAHTVRALAVRYARP